MGKDDALCVDFRVVGCCCFDSLCWAEVEILMLSTVEGEGIGWGGCVRVY